MPEHINHQRVHQAFSQASAHYEDYTVLQREVAERLIAHLNFTKLAPARILDIGCGTGYCTRQLIKKYPKAHTIACDLSEAMLHETRKRQAMRMPWHGKHSYVTNDAEALPFADGSFDLITSSLTMQWVQNPSRMMQEMRRVLAPGGLLLFSTFGRRTLSELRQSLRAISDDAAARVLPFPDVMSLGDALMQQAVELPVTDCDTFTLTYANCMALARELKGMGASAKAIEGRKGGLYGRKLMRELQAHYQSRYQHDDGHIPATFEVLYAQAWYQEPAAHQRDGVIPIQAL